ncbi:MAG: flagellar biosynthetic protein FliP, partial [Alphaproteobacteria bacterium]|nr:flagellar biosynthetic protein FliP [Alphaproteobacteria bacterium]
MRRGAILSAFGLAMLLLGGPAVAQTVTLDLGQSGSLSGGLLQLIALTTILSLAPGILVMVTSFTRIVVVLSFLRSAMGVQQAPPNAVLISLAMFLTFFVMAPVVEESYQAGIKPLIDDQINEEQAFTRAVAPL